MAWNSGTFSRVHDWTDDQGNGIKIRADRHDQEDDNLATGINTCLTKDGQNSPSADLPMATYKHTGVGNATARNQYAAVGQVQDQSFVWCGTAGGTKNALTLSPSPVITAYAAGQRFVFKSGSTASDDAVTVDVNSVGAVAIQSNGAALSSTVYIEANLWYEITYDGTAFQIVKIGLTSGSLQDIANISQDAGQGIISNGTNWVGAPIYYDNILHNGDFQVWQRGTTFDSTTTPANSDDNYLADGCVYLAETTDVADISRESTEVPTGSLYSLKADVETANNQFGFVFPVEAAVAEQIIGGTASLSFKAKIGGSNATLGTIRAAIISWSSTADSITSDVVGTWAGSGTNPTLATNWTYENTPSDLALTTDFQTFEIQNVSIDTASTANVAVFIWVDDEDATVADLLYIADVNLVPGAIATSIRHRPIAEQLILCQRYFYAYDSDTTGAYLTNGQCSTTTAAFITFWLPVEPRISITGITASTASNFGVARADATIANLSTISFGSASRRSVSISVTIGSALLVAGNATSLYSQSTDGYIFFTGAEL